MATTKVLCVCRYGHSRSVSLARQLHRRGIEAVAVGHGTAGRIALEVLGLWADHIMILDVSFSKHVPPQFRHKVVSMHVGPDRWINPFHPELEKLLNEMLDVWLEKQTGHWRPGCGDGTTWHPDHAQPIAAAINEEADAIEKTVANGVDHFQVHFAGISCCYNHTTLRQWGKGFEDCARERLYTFISIATPGDELQIADQRIKAVALARQVLLFEDEAYENKPLDLSHGEAGEQLSDSMCGPGIDSCSAGCVSEVETNGLHIATPNDEESSCPAN